MMCQQDTTIGLLQDWHTFLKQNEDAQAIVQNLMIRTGLTKNEALFYLLAEWERAPIAAKAGISGR